MSVSPARCSDCARWSSLICTHSFTEGVFDDKTRVSQGSSSSEDANFAMPYIAAMASMVFLHTGLVNPSEEIQHLISAFEQKLVTTHLPSGTQSSQENSRGDEHHGHWRTPAASAKLKITNVSGGTAPARLRTLWMKTNFQVTINRQPRPSLTPIR